MQRISPIMQWHTNGATLSYFLLYPKWGLFTVIHCDVLTKYLACYMKYVCCRGSIGVMRVRRSIDLWKLVRILLFLSFFPSFLLLVLLFSY